VENGKRGVGLTPKLPKRPLDLTSGGRIPLFASRHNPDHVRRSAVREFKLTGLRDPEYLPPRRIVNVRRENGRRNTRAPAIGDQRGAPDTRG